MMMWVQFWLLCFKNKKKRVYSCLFVFSALFSGKAMLSDNVHAWQSNARVNMMGLSHLSYIESCKIKTNVAIHIYHTLCIELNTSSFCNLMNENHKNKFETYRALDPYASSLLKRLHWQKPLLAFRFSLVSSTSNISFFQHNHPLYSTVGFPFFLSLGMTRTQTHLRTWHVAFNLPMHSIVQSHTFNCILHFIDVHIRVCVCVCIRL